MGRSPVSPMQPDAMQEIINVLFPEREDRDSPVWTIPDDECPLFSAAELRRVVRGLKGGRAPSPDGIPVEVYKALVPQHEELLLSTYNSCISVGVFPARWRLQRLVLLDKGKGPPYTPSSYRPLCMLDVAGKIFESLIRNRLRIEVANGGGLAENQHGFRLGCCTISAISEALSFAKRAWTGNYRSLLSHTVHPSLVATKVDTWLSDHGMSLAKAKTEVIVLTAQRWFPSPFRALVVDQHVESGSYLKYLGVTIDTKLTFRDQIVGAAKKATTLVASLSRLMPNVGGPRSSRRRVFMSVSHSIMLYGAEIWCESLKAESYRRRLASVQRRGAVRVACAYRTVSEAAVAVIAGVIPIDLSGFERKRIWDARRAGEEPLESVKAREREETLKLWQERWESAETGRWSFRLIKRVRDWITRKGGGGVDYYLTQFLSSHGQFNEYLYRMGIRTDPYCQYCPNVVDSAEHTFFFCQRWSEIRLRFQNEKEVPNVADLVIPWMLATADNYRTMTVFVKEVLKEKKKEEETER
ncbi:uncharacterized protein LOC106694084 [Microplitis demolitor]|uniref:uncharacterized protein LOC106694084 n=1 Tax=Microplitis demolitor TaxID=69319 RepID=UPI00235B5F33|nr:uncharacterized protein LOC106694084 [Microplitis demolitor]